MSQLNFHSRKSTFSIQVEKEQGNWLVQILPKLSDLNSKTWTFSELKLDFEKQNEEDFEIFWNSKPLLILRENGLLSL
jgi:hypothetical protein